jgi:hypothetical protein
MIAFAGVDVPIITDGATVRLSMAESREPPRRWLWLLVS